jgi:hypothetical protein
VVRSSEPFPEGIEEFSGGLLVEDDHALTGSVWVQFDVVTVFTAYQWGETPWTAVHRARDVNNAAIPVTTDRR